MENVVLLVRARALAATGEGRRRREAAGLSIRELAAAIGVDAPTLSRWELGRMRPRRASALRWLAILDEVSGSMPEVHA
jgi:transcriptional regulator with XRE-family HTH domain